MNATRTGGSAAAPGRSGSSGVRAVVRRVVLGVGIVSVMAGLAIPAYIGWQYQVTDLIAVQRQDALRAELHASWRYPAVTDVIGPEAELTRLGTPIGLIRVPRFGEDYEVPLIEGVRGQDLARGIGHFPGAGPGQLGNFAVTAHQVTHGDAFSDLPELRPGDTVVVALPGVTYTYVIDTDPDDLSVSFAETWVIDDVPVPPEGEAPPGMPTQATGSPTTALITLTTCSEMFHGRERMVAFGHLTAVSAS